LVLQIFCKIASRAIRGGRVPSKVEDYPMPTREEHLADRTYKTEGLDVEKRVFYCLRGDSPARGETIQAHRNSKAIALLFKTMYEAGGLTGDQLDEMLLEITY
jgi:hypothetical protein